MLFLFILGLILLFLSISWGRELYAKRKLQVATARETEKFSGMYLHPSHSYARLVGEGIVEIGVDDFAGKAFGKFDLLNLPKIDQKVNQNDVAWKVKVGARYATQRIPVSGSVTEINSHFSGGSNWILKLKSSQLKQNLPRLINGPAIKNWLKSEKARFAITFADEVVPAIQDGGELIDGFGKHLTDEQWSDFCTNFLERNDHKE
jgi:glycine cleavage system H lipoate-binding protein